MCVIQARVLVTAVSSVVLGGTAFGAVDVAAGPALELPIVGFGCSGAGYGGEISLAHPLGPVVVGPRVGALGWSAPGACHTTFGQSRENDGVSEASSWGLVLQAFVAAPLLRRDDVSLLIAGSVGARRVTYSFDPSIEPTSIRWFPQVQVSSRLAYALGGPWHLGAELGAMGIADFDRGPSSALGPPISRFGLAVDAVVSAVATF
jgi:hypothetical protein